MDRNQRFRDFYDTTAPDYDRWLEYYERWMGIREGRQRLVSRAHGRTLEVGVGTGANLAHYSPDVRLTGIDLSPSMLKFAEQRARNLGMTVNLQVADAHHLPFPDEQFDAVVATLVLSTVPDPRRALAKMRRVLRPGGMLLVLDHVRSPIPPLRWTQRLIEPLAVRFASLHITRDPRVEAESIGFSVDACRRSRWGMVQELVAARAEGTATAE